VLASARRFFLGLLIAQRAGRPARVPARPAAACGAPSQTGYSITYPLISITDLRPPEISARLSVSRYFLKYSLHTFGGGSSGTMVRTALCIARSPVAGGAGGGRSGAATASHLNAATALACTHLSE